MHEGVHYEIYVRSSLNPIFALLDEALTLDEARARVERFKSRKFDVGEELEIRAVNLVETWKNPVDNSDSGW